MITDEVITKDFMERALGGKAFNSSPLSNLVENQELGRMQIFSDQGVLLGEIGILPDGRFGFRILDEAGNNAMFQGRDGDFYGVKTALPDTDVFDDDNILFATNRVPIRMQMSTFMNQPDAINQSMEGFISYDGTSRNHVLRLPFMIQDDMVVTAAIVRVIFFDTSYSSGIVRLKGMSVYLNPIGTKIDGASDQDYVRFSGGTSFLSSYDPIKNQEEKNIDFSAAQLVEIKPGYNEIIVQQDFADTGVAFFGYAQASIQVDGYKIY